MEPARMRDLAIGIATGAGAAFAAEGIRKILWQRPRPETAPLGPFPATTDLGFHWLLASLARAPLMGGNQVRLHDGTKRYKAALLDALGSAKRSICFEMFWWHEGRFSDAVTDRLVDATERGVEVRLIVDGFGADAIGSPTFDRMHAAGVDIQVFHPVRWGHLHRMSERTHRRILVVDGGRALTGGVGIGDEWLGDPDHPAWTDLLVEVEGPGAVGLLAVFTDHWRVLTGDPLTYTGLIVQDERPGEAAVQVLSSDRVDRAERLRSALLLGVAAARRRIRIVTPYFVPDRLLVAELVRAARRGVDVEVIVPGQHIDLPVVRRASRSLWGPLLEAGVTIMEYQPSMLHSKALVVDDSWALLGTLNLDERSFRLNAEVALSCGSPQLIDPLNRSLDAYVKDAIPVVPRVWAHRPLGQRAVDRTAAVLRPQM